MTYYLKYRPQTLAEIVGQKHIKEALYQAFVNNKLSHAYLFCGLRGTGKTSTARILAKMVNCESQESRVKKKTMLLLDSCRLQLVTSPVTNALRVYLLQMVQIWT